MSAATGAKGKSLAELYPQLKLLHVLAVIVSGSLFFLRGIGVQAGAGFAMSAPLRYSSYAIDTVLLGSAIALIVALDGMVLESSWLWMKLLLLPVYIVLGSFALKRAKTPAARRVFFGLAVLVFLYMYRVARSHDPFAGAGLYF